MMMENVENFKKINSLLLKRDKYPRKWTPYIAEYFFYFDRNSEKRK